MNGGLSDKGSPFCFFKKFWFANHLIMEILLCWQCIYRITNKIHFLKIICNKKWNGKITHNWTYYHFLNIFIVQFKKLWGGNLENNGQQVVFCENCGSNNVIRDTAPFALKGLPLHLIPATGWGAIPIFIFSAPIQFKCNICKHITKVSKKNYKNFKSENK